MANLPTLGGPAGEGAEGKGPEGLEEYPPLSGLPPAPQGKGSIERPAGTIYKEARLIRAAHDRGWVTDEVGRLAAEKMEAILKGGLGGMRDQINAARTIAQLAGVDVRREQIASQEQRSESHDATALLRAALSSPQGAADLARLTNTLIPPTDQVGSSHQHVSIPQAQDPHPGLMCPAGTGGGALPPSGILQPGSLSHPTGTVSAGPPPGIAQPTSFTDTTGTGPEGIEGNGSATIPPPSSPDLFRVFVREVDRRYEKAHVSVAGRGGVLEATVTLPSMEKLLGCRASEGDEVECSQEALGRLEQCKAKG
jgi:hypothetical protein